MAHDYYKYGVEESNWKLKGTRGAYDISILMSIMEGWELGG